MLVNIIYISIAAILIFVLYLAVQAITRGVEAKSDLKSENDNDNLSKTEIDNEKKDIYEEIKKINKLYSDGILSEDEFKKAKEKILK
tara:strand:+ start:232 stop:492 length:261 start_codon:yes stop_codon:yes gene_type:complete